MDSREREEKERAVLGLGRYATVKAALGEGFGLDEALAAEELTRAEWTAADLVWKRRLAADPPQFAAYAEELARAEDALVRAVPPIDEDVFAWTAFRKAVADEGASKVLAANGLRANDLARLTRLWQRRAADDPAIARALAGAHKHGALSLPPIHPAMACRPRRRSAAAGELEVDAVAPSASLEEPAFQGYFARYRPRARSADAASEAIAAATDRSAESPNANATLPPASVREAITGTALAVDVPALEALPFPKRREEPRNVPSLTLEQHAHLCAELALFPAHATDILERHRLTHTSKIRLDAQHRATVASAPGLLEAWQRAYGAACAWFAYQRAGRSTG